MGQIPDNFILVPDGSATAIPMDIDVMTRKTIIYLYDVMNKQNQPLQPYDDYYYQLKKDKGITIDKNEPGAANIFYPIYYNTCATINVMISQFIALMKPIETALQLPELLLNPPKLLKTIKKIIDMIVKLIEEIIKMITDTKNWFIEKFLGIFKDIKLPPEIGELYTNLFNNIDAIIQGILAAILKFKDDASLMITKLIATLTTQLDNLEKELKKLIENDLAESLRKRNDIILNFLPQFNEGESLTLTNNWLDALNKIQVFLLIDIKFINDNWAIMLDDKDKILKDMNKTLADEEKSLTKINKDTDPDDYKEEKQIIDDLKIKINDWNNDIVYDKNTTLNNSQKLNRLVVERQKIIDYYVSKKTFLEKLKIEINKKIEDAKQKLKEIKDSISKKSKEISDSVSTKVKVVNAYVKAIIKAILFPFTVIGEVIQNLIKAITGFLENIPDLTKMLEGVKKLVDSLKKLLDPTKILEFLSDLMIDIFDGIKPGFKKVMSWMKINGGINTKGIQKAIEWCKKNVPEILDFVTNFLGMIIRIIGLVPMMIQIIIKAYIDYALQVVPSPVKSLIGLT